MKYTLDELLLRKWDGWTMKEFLFLSVIGELSFLRDFDQIERSDDYAGVRGMSICIVSSPERASAAYSEAEKLISMGCQTIGIWVLGKPYVKEIVFNGHRSPVEGNILLDSGWESVVKQLCEVMK